MLLAFADDIVIIARSAAEMQAILDRLLNYCILNKLRVSTRKTKVVIFKKGGRNLQNINFYYGNEEIKIVKEYTYLGVCFSKSGLVRRLNSSPRNPASLRYLLWELSNEQR